MADRFSQQVDTRTVVNFRVEAGQVNASAQVTAGAVKATPTTSLPRPSFYYIDYDDEVTGALRPGHVIKIPGVPYAYDRIPHRPYPDENALFYPGGAFGPSGVTGLLTLERVRQNSYVTLIGYTQGEETFVDTNANDVWDPGEPYIDVAEPFVDKNDNNRQDDCMVDDLTGPVPFTNDSEEFLACYEDYIDLNGDHEWNDGNGKWDNYTTIWKSIRLRWHDRVVPDLFPWAPTGPVLDIASGQLFTPGTLTPNASASDYGLSTIPTIPIGAAGVVGGNGTQFVVNMFDQYFGCDLLPSDQSSTTTAKITGSIDSITTKVYLDNSCVRRVAIVDAGSGDARVWTGPGPTGTVGTKFGTLEVEQKNASDSVYTLEWPIMLQYAPSTSSHP
jgi:hypothetical protein